MRTVGGVETRRNVLVDGNNLIHRAYFAYCESRVREGLDPLTSNQGYPTGVIYGSLSMLTGWLYEIENPSGISVFFDGVPKRRIEIDPNYKKDRDFTERGLKMSDPSKSGRKPKKLVDGYEAECEIDILAHILGLAGCQVYHDAEEEADDLIASFVKSHADEVNIIVSDDKDFFQLLTNPRVIIYRPGGKDGRFYDAEKAEQHWARLNKGKHPAVPVGSVRMFKSLCGDSSDGIVGIERLRKKVAVPLCYLASVDQLYASGFPDWSQSEKEKALFLRNRIRINYELVGFHDDVELEKSRRKVDKDLPMAKLILTDDLNINGIDLFPFRIGEDSAKPEFRNVVPDWLADF